MSASLTIIIPAYNEARRIGTTLDTVRRYVATTGIDATLVVVDDGSTDGTSHAARAHAPEATVIRLPTNRGKGAAIRAGMATAASAHVLTCDADLATPITELPRFVAAIEAGADIVVSSRHISGAVIERTQPWVRRVLGAGFRAATRAALRLPVRDPMCGFKLFRLEAARWLFARARIDGFACDIEVMYLARDRYRIAELPVRWRHVDGSRVQVGQASWRAVRDIGRIVVRGRAD